MSHWRFIPHQLHVCELMFQNGKEETTGCELSLKHTCCHCSAQLPVTVSFSLPFGSHYRTVI